MTADQALNHHWLQEDNQLVLNQAKLDNVSSNLHNYAHASNFQKTIFSILSGLKVQREELHELKAAFLTLDVNGDGTLSFAELKDGLGKLCLFEIAQDHTEGDDCFVEIMKTCDLDGDDKIDYLEFIQAAVNHKSLMNKQNIHLVFSIFDQN